MKYLLRRAVFYLTAAWFAITVNFFLPRLMPGNPALIAASRYRGIVSPQALGSLTKLFGISKAPLYSQYVTYLGQLAHGQLGTSLLYFPTPVSRVIGGTLPYTLVLVGLTTLISFIVGTLLGVVVAWRRGSWLDSVVYVSTFFTAIPYFWLALLLLYLFGVAFPVLPISGAFSLTDSPAFTLSFLNDAFIHAILPASSIIVASLASWLIGMRNFMLSTLGEDYVLLAEAKGVRRRRIMFSYAARNAILPNVASLAVAIGVIVGGAVLTEIVFSYPGIGYTLYQAVLNEDYPLMQGIFLILALAVLLANFLADSMYVLLDPRARRAPA